MPVRHPNWPTGVQPPPLRALSRRNVPAGPKIDMRVIQHHGGVDEVGPQSWPLHLRSDRAVALALAIRSPLRRAPEDRFSHLRIEPINYWSHSDSPKRPPGPRGALMLQLAGKAALA